MCTQATRCDICCPYALRAVPARWSIQLGEGEILENDICSWSGAHWPAPRASESGMPSDDVDRAVSLHLSNLTVMCVRTAAENARLDALRGCAQCSMSP